jgi:hypothetical protein
MLILVSLLICPALGVLVPLFVEWADGSDLVK